MGSSIIYGIVCNLLPILAWSVINQDWQFDIPLLGITYKPWRLYVVVCSLPGLLAFIIMTFLPESPKFVLGLGNQAKARQILLKMNRVNNGKNSILEVFEIYEEPESIENRKKIADCKNERFPLLTSIWNQTVPLFQRPYLFPTLLICCIQFFVYATSNGLYMFSAEILNRMGENLDDFTNQRVQMCDVINMQATEVNGTDDLNQVSY